MQTKREVVELGHPRGPAHSRCFATHLKVKNHLQPSAIVIEITYVYIIPLRKTYIFVVNHILAMGFFCY